VGCSESIFISAPRTPLRVADAVEKKMGRAKDADLRWLVVYTRLVKGASVSVTARQCSVSKCFVKHMLKLFERTHGVEDMQGQRHAPPANQVMTAEAARALLHQMLDVPELTLGEHASNLVEDGVVATVDESTLSRVCAALRMSQKKLQVYAIQRDAERARLHVVMMVRDYTASMHLHLDETSKNRKHALRRRGWAPMGRPAISSMRCNGRGRSLSWLTSFDIEGFRAWAWTEGRFTYETFLEAAEEVVYPYVNAFPGPRSIVLLDNASIHHSRAFVRRVNRLGGMVIFLPPYCFTTSPLDNGAYGLVVRWLQRNAGRVRAVGLQQGMDEALSSLSASDARYCFQNCGYVVR